MKNIVFTDHDLDGAGSLLGIFWYLKKDVPFIVTNVLKVPVLIKKWIETTNISDYDNVFILDLALDAETIKLIDKPNVTVIDHHEDHINNSHLYKHAKVLIKDETSTAKIILNSLLNTTPLLPAQKLLLLLVDDYDSYTLKIPQSYDLNLIFGNYQGTRAKEFIKNYRDGFKPFSQKQKSIIDFYKTKIKETIDNLEIHKASFSFNNENITALATFASSHINDVGNYLLDQDGCDVAIIINVNSQKVSFRTKKDINVSVLANRLCEGGGHPKASGGEITEQFTKFTNIFEPYEQ